MSPGLALICGIGIISLPWILIGSCVVRAARRAVADTQVGKHWLRVCFGGIMRATLTAILPISFGISVLIITYHEAQSGLQDQLYFIGVFLILGLFLAGLLGLFLSLIAFGAGLYRLDRVVPALKATIVLLATSSVFSLTQGSF